VWALRRPCRRRPRARNAADARDVVVAEARTRCAGQPVRACSTVGRQGATASRPTGRRSAQDGFPGGGDAQPSARAARLPVGRDEDADAAGVHEGDVSEGRHDPGAGVASAGPRGLVNCPVPSWSVRPRTVTTRTPLGELDGRAAGVRSRHVARGLLDCSGTCSRGTGTRTCAPRVRADALTGTAAHETPAHDGGQSGIPDLA
jgi:hypothetical protein